MELSKETLQGLSGLQNTNILTEDTFLHTIEAVLSHICQKPGEVKNVANVCGSKPDVVKKAFIDISCLFAEGARHDYNESNLENFLRNKHIGGQRIKKLVDAYVSNKSEIQAQLQLTGNCLPHIVDIDWRLDYCVKLDSNKFVGTPIYHVRLSTKKYDELKYVIFTCSMQELQDLVYKLKDAVRHIEKIGNI